MSNISLTDESPIKPFSILKNTRLASSVVDCLREEITLEQIKSIDQITSDMIEMSGELSRAQYIINKREDQIANLLLEMACLKDKLCMEREAAHHRQAVAEREQRKQDIKDGKLIYSMGQYFHTGTTG